MQWNILNLFTFHTDSGINQWFKTLKLALLPADLLPANGELAWNHLSDGGSPPIKDWAEGRGLPGLGGGSRWSNLGIGSEGDNAGDEDIEGIYHTPVMPDEVVQWLAPALGKLLMDCTFGGGGHTKRLLERGAGVLALDRDADALMQSQELAEEWEKDFVAMRTSFDRYPNILGETGVVGVDGILLDVGVSSWQVDSPNRGFSFRFDGPLDMRMDRDAPLTAEEIVNTWPEEELARVIYTYGEEKASRRVAAAIVARRRQKAILTTTELADLVASVIPRHSGAHPATKVFQALRIAVNDELGCLERALEQAHQWLRPVGD